jgi:hypothetical protein
MGDGWCVSLSWAASGGRLGDADCFREGAAGPCAVAGLLFDFEDVRWPERLTNLHVCAQRVTWLRRLGAWGRFEGQTPARIAET